MKSVLIFAICFLVGAMVAIGVRAVLHRPYAEPTQAHSMAAPAATPGSTPQPVAPGGHEHHATPSAPNRPAPEQTTPVPHQDHGKTPTAVADPSAAIGNTICPGCGMDVDADIAAIPTPHGLVGIACPPCIPKVTREPERYGAAARENRKAE
ncbi:MAG: hypothetical protein H0W72_03055 [Planctomycetes bacterium]|nr:hypothetical protein [Planctomycetota bacterium]